MGALLAEWLGRVGYVSRGAVYALIAYYAVRAGLHGDHVRDPDAVLRALSTVLPGSSLVWLMGLGLAAFAIWRVAQSLFDLDRHGTAAKALVLRAVLLFSAALYGSLAVTAMHIGLGDGAARPRSVAAWSAEAMSLPGGRAILFVGALVLLATAVAHFHKAHIRGYERYLRLPAHRQWLTVIARTGLCARGLIFLLMSAFLFLAAWRADPEQAKGVREVLRWFEHLDHREAACYLLAVGLAAFALYSGTEGVLRKRSIA
jgi:hypothetical protein